MLFASPLSDMCKPLHLAGCIVVFLVILGGIGFLVGDSSTKSNTDSNEPQVERNTDFNAEVTFNGSQFIITNVDDYNCIDSWMSVNNKYWLKGYTLEKGQTYTVGAAEFTEGDNTRFNPFTIKPASYSIICRGNNELNQAIWAGQF